MGTCRRGSEVSVRFPGKPSGGAPPLGSAPLREVLINACHYRRYSAWRLSAEAGTASTIVPMPHCCTSASFERVHRALCVTIDVVRFWGDIYAIQSNTTDRRLAARFPASIERPPFLASRIPSPAGAGREAVRFRFFRLPFTPRCIGFEELSRLDGLLSIYDASVAQEVADSVHLASVVLRRLSYRR